VAAGSACPILAGNKANIVIAGTQTFLPIYLLSFSFKEEKRWRGVKLGDKDKSNQFHFSSFLFLYSLVSMWPQAQSKAAILSLCCCCE